MYLIISTRNVNIYLFHVFSKFYGAGYEYKVILSDKIFVIGLVWTTVFIMATFADSNLFKVLIHLGFLYNLCKM